MKSQEKSPQLRAAGSNRNPCEQKEKRTTRVRFSFWQV
jgi:hypothetical protein